MSTNKWLIAVATAALITGTAGAFAQQEPPRGAPAEKIAPKSQGNTPAATPGGQNGGAMHNGAAEPRGGQAAEEHGERNAPSRSGQAQPKGRSETTGQAPQNERQNERQGQKPEPNRAAEPNRGNDVNEKNKTNRSETTTEPNRANEQNRGAERGNVRGNERRETTGQGAAPGRGASVNVTPEHRTQIRDVIIKERSAPRVEHVDFDVNVGTVIPRSFRVVAVPQRIVEIEPEWRGFEYFMLGDQIVIVDPNTMEIVAVLDA